MNPSSILLCLYLLMFSTISKAQWSSNPLINTPVCNAVLGQYDPKIVSDGAGGAIMTWWDDRLGNAVNEIYAQRVNAEGVIQWATNGVLICSVPFSQSLYPVITTDGSGGAIIVWTDARGTGRGIYAQRINGAGVVQWAVNGVEVYTAPNFIAIQSIISDDAGGAIISWSDAGSGSFSDNFAQHINASGTNLWGVSGVSICAASNNQSSPAVIKDAAGGYIFAWNDFRNGINWDVYAQRLDATGVIQWAFNGIPVAVTSNDQLGSNLVSDGSGGAIITWTDDRASAVGLTDIYAQRVNSSGVVQWASNGLTVCTATDFQFSPEIISDGSGGAIICWYDGRVAGFDIYAQRINSSGTAQWLLNGVAISAAASNQREQKIVEDGAGGAIMIWMDYRNGNEDIYAQRVDAAGNVLWTNNGVAVSIAAGLQAVPEIAGNGSGGAIIAWQDNRNAGVADIYTQGISGNGLLPLKLVSFNAVYNSGNHAADISWQTSNEINTRLFDIQKSEDAIVFKTIGQKNATGNTSATVTYNYMDKHPFKTDQEYAFYRLKLIDNNRSYTYSKTVRLKSDQQSSLAIYPNPAAKQLTFSFNAERDEATFFSITDTKGNKMVSQNIILKKGNNSFSVNISFLAPGTYIVYIGNKINYYGKFIKTSG